MEGKQGGEAKEESKKAESVTAVSSKPAEQSYGAAASKSPSRHPVSHVPIHRLSGNSLVAASTHAKAVLFWRAWM
jgi:hypothetical protein